MFQRLAIFLRLELICGYAAATLEGWLLADNHRLLIFYFVAGAILFLLVRRNYLAAAGRVRFEEQPEDAPVILDLRN
jgi:hypothetical protein